LYLNFELKASTFNQRVHWIKKALGIKEHDMHAMHLRGKARCITDLVRQTKKKILNGGFKLVILDPIYKCLGDRDENSARDMTDYVNQIDLWLTESKASVVMVGHTPKGDMSLRKGNDRLVGSNVVTRDGDVNANFLISESKSDELKTKVIEVEFSGMREDPEIPKFYAQWKGFVFEAIEGTVAKEIRNDQKLELNDMMDALQAVGGTCQPGGWLEYYNSVYRPNKPMPHQTFLKKRKKLTEMDLIVDNGESTTKCAYSISKVAKRNESGDWLRTIPSLKQAC
jgi:hypothetical protein